MNNFREHFEKKFKTFRTALLANPILLKPYHLNLKLAPDIIDLITKTPKNYLLYYFFLKAPTTYHIGGELQCHSDRNRSVGDLYYILKAQFPNITVRRAVFEITDLLYNGWIIALNCPEVDLKVFHLSHYRVRHIITTEEEFEDALTLSVLQQAFSTPLFDFPYFDLSTKSTFKANYANIIIDNPNNDDLITTLSKEDMNYYNNTDYDEDDEFEDDQDTLHDIQCSPDFSFSNSPTDISLNTLIFAAITYTERYKKAFNKPKAWIKK